MGDLEVLDDVIIDYACVTSVLFSFLINREVQGRVTSVRGIRQGHMLYSYLFLLCAHGLSKMFSRYKEIQIISRVRIAQDSPLITHL